MKKIYLLVALFAIFACQKEELTVDNTSSQQYTIGVNSEPSVKSSINGMTFTWTEGDVMSIMQSNNKCANFTIASGQGTASASFTGAPTEGQSFSGNVYAIYPEQSWHDYDAFKNEKGKIVSILYPQFSQTQNYTEDGNLDPTSIAKHICLYGKSTTPVGAGNQLPNIQMIPASDILDITIKGIPSSPITISNLKIKGKFSPYNYIKFDESDQPTMSQAKEDNKEINIALTYNGTPGKELIEGAVIRVAHLGQKIYKDAVWDFELTTSDGTYIAQKIFTKNFKTQGGKVYNTEVTFEKQVNTTHALVGTWNLHQIGIWGDGYDSDRLTTNWDGDSPILGLIPNSDKEMDNVFTFTQTEQVGNTTFKGTFTNAAGDDAEYADFTLNTYDFNARFRKFPKNEGTWTITDNKLTISSGELTTSFTYTIPTWGDNLMEFKTENLGATVETPNEEPYKELNKAWAFWYVFKK